MLNLPDGVAGARPAKKQKLSAARPNLKGLAREVHNLGGDNPIAIVPEVTQFKKRRLASRKPAARWELRKFRNSARDDQSLVLRHWRRADTKVEAVATTTTTTEEQGESAAAAPTDDVEDSAFAKYNVRVSVPQYTDDQYLHNLQNEDWTREETDYLMELARDFDLRWPLVWDRYEWNPPAMNGEADADGDESKAVVPTVRQRTLEDLKARYYEVAAKMMAVNKPVQYMTQPEFALHELMSHYNPQQERVRKDFAINSLSRSREEAREEESLLMEIKRILARSEKFNEERRELYNRLDYPHAETDISTFKSSAGLQTLLQNLMNVDKTKKRKSIMGAEGVSPAQGTPQAAAAQESAGKKEAAAAAAAAAAASNRESTGPASTPTAVGKKTPQQPHERRKLSEQEEAIYGVTHHDRLGSGPTFRTEKINKLFSHKSNQQQLRINNTLNELDVPSKLAMPTSATTQQFEALLAAVNSLLDARKVFDKLDAEIKIEEAKKAEREKALAGPDAAEGDAAAGESGEKTEDKLGDEAAVAAEGEAADGKVDEAAPTIEEADADEEAEKAEDAAEAEDKAEELPADKEKSTPGPTSHKRSASVLSTMSDKSSKRQKK